MIGTKNDDTLRGDTDDNALYGKKGDDRLYGGSGDDTLRGGKGDDTLLAGDGDDILNGGEGRDFLLGSQQLHNTRDTFVLKNPASSLGRADIIYRFERYEGDFRPGDTIRFDRDITQIWFKHEDVNGDGRTDTVLYNNAEGRADVEGGGVYGVINDFAGWPDPENLSNGRDNSFILALEIV